MPSLSSPVIPVMENNAGNLIEDSFPESSADAKLVIDDEDPIKSNLSIEDGKKPQTPRESNLSSDATDPEECQIPPRSNILCDSKDPEPESNLATNVRDPYCIYKIYIYSIYIYSKDRL